MFEHVNWDLRTVNACHQRGGENYLLFPAGVPEATKPRPCVRAWPVYAVRVEWYSSLRFDGFADGKVTKFRFYKWLTAAQARSFRRGNYRARPKDF